MKVEECIWFDDFIRMADDAWHMGWHESNGGNLSYRISKEDVDKIKGSLTAGEWNDIGLSLPGIAGEYFLVTGSGKHFRNIMHKPDDALGIIETDETGEKYRIVWGFKNGGKPTSELYSHLLNHQIKKQQTNGRYRVVYHNHPSNVIALTYLLPLNAETFTKELWGIMTECPIVIPKGIGVLEWVVPGSRELGEATSKLMERFDAAIWAHHGMFITAADADQAFGVAHTVEKSAGILLKQMAVSRNRLSGITADQFRQLDRAYNIGIDESFL